jgi:hypothetical protein
MMGVLGSKSGRHTRALLLGVATVCGTLAATTLVRRGGLSWVNVDTVLRDPSGFYLRLALPGGLAVACVMAALLPRIVTINAAVTVCLLGLLEGGAWLLRPTPPEVRGQPRAIETSRFYVPDAHLGYVMAPSTTAHHRRTVGDRLIYDVVYRTDGWGRRDTPVLAGTERTAFLLCFGDSNMFGEGLAQTETLPYFAAEAGPAYRPYNYGVSGYGPSNLLALARRGGLRQEVVERAGDAFFLLIPAHVARVIGSSRVSTSWGRRFPYYVQNGRGELVTPGNFVHGRQFTTLAYFFWTRSNLAESLRVDLPLWYTTDDYRLTARILDESRRLLARQLELRRFVVVLAQVYDDVQQQTMHRLREALVAEGVPYLDYTQLFDSRDLRYRLAESDYHYSAEANRILAARLVANLGQGR